jgi:hypothetical protein
MLHSCLTQPFLLHTVRIILFPHRARAQYQDGKPLSFHSSNLKGQIRPQAARTHVHVFDWASESFPLPAAQPPQPAMGAKKQTTCLACLPEPAAGFHAQRFFYGKAEDKPKQPMRS